jgi:hypothetical protein
VAASGPSPFGDVDPIGRVLSDPDRRKEIDILLNDCKDRVRNLLLKKRHVVDGVRDALLERDELIGDEIEALMADLGEREPIEVPVGVAAAIGGNGGIPVPGGNGQGDGDGDGRGPAAADPPPQP